MLFDELAAELHKLSRSEKIRALQLLANDIAAEEIPALNGHYEVWSPYDAGEAAVDLARLLKAAWSYEFLS
jgi:hypothetical protein